MAEKTKIERYYAFPDLHGCSRLLNKALHHVYSENPNGGKIVFLGDYIDRGQDNKGVLKAVMNPKEGWEHICLMGNHERMFLDSYHYHTEFYDKWVIQEFTSANIEEMTVSEQCEIIPIEIIDWMKTLKLFHIIDDNVFAHAYYNDRQEHQYEQQVLWYRMSDFEAYPSEKYFLTHGHTPRKHGPVTAPNRINMDIGITAYDQYAIAEYEVGKKGPVKLHKFE